MGYTQHLPITKPGGVADADVTEIVGLLEASPPWRGRPFGGRQSWGWSSFVDVSLRGDAICFSWALSSDPLGFPEAFHREALNRGLPVGDLGEASW